MNKEIKPTIKVEHNRSTYMCLSRHSRGFRCSGDNKVISLCYGCASYFPEKTYTEKEIGHLWQPGRKEPKDGSWIYVVRLVDCLNCESEEGFALAHFVYGKWHHQNGHPIEKKVFAWINIELFYQLKMGYNVEE